MAPMPWQSWGVSYYGSFTELSGLDLDRSSGRGLSFFIAFEPHGTTN